MSSFPSLHDALSSLLPGARSGQDWMPGPGMPGFGDGIDPEDRRAEPARGPGDAGPDIDAEGGARPRTDADGGHAFLRQGNGDTGGPPAHARPAMSDPLRGQAAQLPTPLPPGQAEPPLLALARELQQLPPSVIRQLSDALANNPDALRELPARPEALAAALSRTAAETVPQAAAAEARRMAPGGDAAGAVPRGLDADSVRDARQPGAAGFPVDPRAAADARAAAALDARQGVPAEARPAWAGGALDSVLAGFAVRAGGEAPPAGPSRAETSVTAAPTPAASPATSAPGSTQAPGAWSAPVQDAAQLPGARAEAAGSTADRGGQGPGLPGLAGAAAGVTLVATGQPAGTTHAYAPESAVRARRARQARDQEREGDVRDQGDAQGEEGKQGRRQRGFADLPSRAVAAASDASTHGRSRPAPEGAAAGHTAASATRRARPDQATGEVPQHQEAEAWVSRRRQALYWSLIAVTYACLGLALATVAPDLTGLPMAAESLATWRNALTGAGLLTGLWAWLLARRMR